MAPDEPDTPGRGTVPASGRRAGRTPDGTPPERLRSDDPGLAQILAAHRAAVDAGEDGYLDPATGLFVLTAAYLRGRGTCCGAGCRHCPFADRAGPGPGGGGGGGR